MKTTRPLLRPKPLEPGDVIGLVAPSSPFPRESLDRGIRFLEAHGFRVRVAPAVFARHRAYLAGSDIQRAQLLMDVVTDPEVRAVMAIRGGYGSLRILGLLQSDAIRHNPKIFLGYSDATALLLYLLDHCGLVPFHGPLVVEMGEPMSRQTEQWLINALTWKKPLGSVPLKDALWIKRGSASGPLVGGNLSVICSSLGTPWEIRTQGRLLFLEECGEKPFRVDRMLTQLRLAGKLDQSVGLLFGRFLPEPSAPVSETRSYTEEVIEIILEVTNDFEGPVLVGLPVGHGVDENITLPLGVEASLDADNAVLTITESALQGD